MSNILYYLSYINPVSGYKGIVSGTSHILEAIGFIPKTTELMQVVSESQQTFSNYAIKLTTISGITAMLIDIYFLKKSNKIACEKSLSSFNIASQYHFLNALIMLGLPMCNFPSMASICIILGKILYCGTYYYHAFTGELLNSKIPIIGKYMFILGWIIMTI